MKNIFRRIEWINIDKLFAERKLPSFLIVFSAFLSYIPNRFDNDSIIYLIGYKHAYNSAVFSGNIFLDEQSFSPRWIADILYSFVMNLFGGRWEFAGWIFIVFSLFVLSCAIVRIVYNLFNNSFELYIVLFSLLYVVNHNELAGGNLFAIYSLSFGVSTAFSILGISYVVGENKDFNKAGIFMGLAMISHVHEGIYGFVIVFIQLVIDFFSNRQKLSLKFLLKKYYGILLYLMSSAAVILPSLLTDKSSISSELFVYIYAFLRHPHHLIPSNWGVLNICTSFAIIATIAGIYLITIYKFKRLKLKKCIFEVALVLIFWLFALFASWLFVEKIPVAAMATLFPLKFFKYGVLLSLIWGLKSVDILIRNHNGLTAVLLLLYMFKTQDWNLPLIFLAFLVISILVIHGSFAFERDNSVEIVYLILLSSVFFTKFIVDIGLNRVILLLFGIIICLLEQMHKNKTIIWSSALILSFSSLIILGSDHLYNSSDYSFITPGQMLNNTVNQSIISVSDSFAKVSDPSDMFLCDPDDSLGAGWIQIMSERNAYVFWKVVPSSKSKIEEWYNRYTLAENLMNSSAENIANGMLDINCKYLLVNGSRYSDIDDSGRFTLVAYSDDDSYRFYQLNDYID